MAKYTRHDSRNKKRNSHKNRSKFDSEYKMKGDGYNRSRDKRIVNAKCDIPVYGGQP